MNITSNISRSLHRVVVRLALVIATFAVAVPARAQMLFTDGVGFANILSDTVGYSFTVNNQPLSAHRLGVYDYLGDGLSTMNIVGLWREGGTLLASAILPSGKSAPLESGFRWFDLSTPVLLDANTTYRLGSQAFQEMHSSGFVTGPISPDITLVGAVRNNQQGNFTYPGSTPFSDQAIVGPNMAYSVVPEPSTLALVVAAAIALIAHRRINLRRRLIKKLGLRC
jgi:hypothetical protein